MERIARLPDGDGEARWLVTDDDGAPAIASLIDEPDATWARAVVEHARMLVGFAHPRVLAVRAIRTIDDHVAVIAADDRGPALADVAAVLADTPDDRERWCAAQAIAIADGLAALARHVPGFVHRSLAPDDLVIGVDGRARLRAPWRVPAREPRRGYLGAGRVIGTPAWMAPEQARGLPTTPATDVHALAANLAFAITGEPPFGYDDNPMELLLRVISTPPALAGVRAPALAAVLARALAKDPAARYADPAAFATALYEAVPDAGDHDLVTSDRVAAAREARLAATGDPLAAPARLQLDGRCAKTWAELTPRADSPDVRDCAACRTQVVRVRSLGALAILGEGRCVYLA